jgi:hypothetical protein
LLIKRCGGIGGGVTALEQLEDTDIRISFRSYDYKLREKYMNMGVTVLMELPKD